MTDEEIRSLINDKFLEAQRFHTEKYEKLNALFREYLLKTDFKKYKDALFEITKLKEDVKIVCETHIEYKDSIESIINLKDRLCSLGLD